MNSIGHYFLRRCLLMIPTFFGITLLTFFVMSLSAGGLDRSAESELSMGRPRLSALERRRVRESMGWDLPALLNLEIQDASGFVAASALSVAEGVSSLSHALRSEPGVWPEEAQQAFIRKVAKAGRFLRDADDLPTPESPRQRSSWERLLIDQKASVVAWALDAGRLMRLGGQTPFYLKPWLKEATPEPVAEKTLLFIAGAAVDEDFSTAESLKQWLEVHPELGESQARALCVDAWHQQSLLVAAKAAEANLLSRQIGQESDRDQRTALQLSLDRLRGNLRVAKQTLGERARDMRSFGALLLPEFMATLDNSDKEIKALASNWLRSHAAWDDSYDATSAFPQAEDSRLRGWWRRRKVTTEELSSWEHLIGSLTQTRYAKWLSKVFRWDFGVSWSQSRSVSKLISERLGTTLLVQGAALLLMFAMAIPLGLIAASNQGSVRDRGLKAWAALVVSMPTFLIATLLMLWLGGAFPLNGLRSPEIAAGIEGGSLSPWSALALKDLFMHLLLPSVALSMTSGAVLARHIRSGMLKSLGSRWAEGMRASGLKESRVRRLAWRTGMLPLVTLVGQLLPWLVGGSVVVEHMFALPGLGSLAFDAATNNDLPLTMAIVTLTAILTMVGYMISDVAIAALDPRVRLT